MSMSVKEKVIRKSRIRREQYLQSKEDQSIAYSVRLQFLLQLLDESLNRGKLHGDQVVDDLMAAIRNVKSKIIRAGREVVRTQTNIPRSKY